MSQQIDRRKILKVSTLLALAAAVNPPTAFAQPSNTVLRRSIGTMAIDDPILDSYRKAIRAMKALPASDNRNWTKQAEIHQNFCPHNNWYFLPWHRAYLLAFERICRELSGDPAFALPYWDWTSTRQLPASFTSPTYQGQPNPLHNATRTIPANFSLPDNMVGPTIVAQLIAEPDFQVFGSGMPSGQNNTDVRWQRRVGISGPLENNPHNRIHGTIGGEMASYMSPLDPIFWLHHCNVDRIWEARREAGHPDAPNPLWRNFAFNGNFWQPNGTTPFNTPVAALQDISSLGYRYGVSTVAINPITTLTLSNRIVPRDISAMDILRATPISVSSPARANVVLNVPVTLDGNQTRAVATVRPPDTAALPATPQAARIFAVIGDVRPPAQGNLDVRVFVNCDYLSPETPTTDPSYAATFSFFGAGHAEHAGHGDGGISYLVDITNTVANLRRTQRPVTDQINVQLMPVAIPGVKEAEEFKLENVRLAIV